ncbi:uncharacterized protein RHOBADRAFT_39745 [Rhodotorula graminis WP1]|uniref:Pantoate--beta-alanine ligase n=1 Tax=Rhodotorula graminis (strain WP1) TaxID=578459 RepID=A0A0P9F8K7_RHOGW|nr:uncharacterized protein RHOBADRAFT_39745 [Rhodotorula graminis WP1]KPV71993.1 hypothetical protein RHOBADRAFT_39745 [Rhodotorula graminis WP1]
MPDQSRPPLPPAPFPILTSVQALRDWRTARFADNESVGFVPTMGALHQGHLSLVKASLAANTHTIVSIFVNPAQFSPTEDLSTYPRTLESDLAALSLLDVSALFLPPVDALYPSGITTDVTKQVGAFVEVKGLDAVMEGKSRPGFFRGVATVVLKLFNLVQPTRAYFGQKDIQQALLLRRMLVDLHVPSPLAHNLVILPTFRSRTSTSDGAGPGLALSSRNAYLSARERPYATVLVDALRAGERVWERQRGEGEGVVCVEDVLGAARAHVEGVVARIAALSSSPSSSSSPNGDSPPEPERDQVPHLSPLYFALNDPLSLSDLSGHLARGSGGAVLSGAVMLGKTRLIDNLVFEFELNPEEPKPRGGAGAGEGEERVAK